MKKIILLFVLAFSLSINAQDSTNVDNFKKTDEVLSEVVKKALTVAEKTGEFVIEQAPLLLQEFYRWHIAKSILGILLGLFILIIGYNLRKIWGKKVDKDHQVEWDNIVINGYASEEVSTVVTFIISGISGSCLIIIYSYNLVFILMAPKLYLIEYFIK